MNNNESVATTKNLPQDLTPLNLHAYLNNSFAVCGCSELDEIITTLVRLLEWHDGNKEEKFTELFPNNVGAFYLLAGLLDDLGLAEHGTAIRYPWLTPDGKRFLEALKQHSAQDIDEASGEAYDGCHHGYI